MAAAVRGRPNLAVPAGRVRPRAEAVDAPSDPLRVSGGVALSLAGAELLPRRAEIDAGPRRSAGVLWQGLRGVLGAGAGQGGSGEDTPGIQSPFYILLPLFPLKKKKDSDD